MNMKEGAFLTSQGFLKLLGEWMPHPVQAW